MKERERLRQRQRKRLRRERLEKTHQRTRDEKNQGWIQNFVLPEDYCKVSFSTQEEQERLWVQTVREGNLKNFMERETLNIPR